MTFSLLIFCLKTSNKYRLPVSIDGFMPIADVIKRSVVKFAFGKYKLHISIQITFSPNRVILFREAKWTDL